MKTYTIPNGLILEDRDTHESGADWPVCCDDGKHYILIPDVCMSYNTDYDKSEISIKENYLANEYGLELYGVYKNDLSNYKYKRTYLYVYTSEYLDRLLSLSEKEIRKLCSVCDKVRKKKNIVDINFPNDYVELRMYNNSCSVDIDDWDGEKVSLFIAKDIMKIVKTDYGWVYSVPMAIDADRSVYFEAHRVYGPVPVTRIKEFADKLVECAKIRYFDEYGADEKDECEDDWALAALAEIEENEREAENEKKEAQDPEPEAAEETEKREEGDE